MAYTIASELSDSGLRILVLEHSTASYGVSQDSGRRLRSRPLGSALFNEMDFGARPWIPNSGWPMSFESIKSYLQIAANRLGISFTDPMYGDSAERTSGFYIDPGMLDRIQLHPANMDTFEKSMNLANSTVRIFSNAVVTQLIVNTSNSRVDTVEIAGASEKRAIVAARIIVLCADAVENARMLLYSTRALRGGVGNLHDLVGRFLMGGERDALPAFNVQQSTVTSATSFPCFVLNANVQRQERLLTSCAWVIPDPSHNRASVFTATEQMPDHASRILLSDDLDENGLPRYIVDWRLHERERTSRLRLHELIVEEYSRSGVGSIRAHIEANLNGRNEVQLDIEKAVGTTRMATSPRNGVVNAHGKVHGLEGLYVTGQSVFPTAGCGDPLLMSVALSLRLAGHLRDGFLA